MPSSARPASSFAVTSRRWMSALASGGTPTSLTPTGSTSRWSSRATDDPRAERNPMPDYQSRQAALAGHMTSAGIDLIFLPVSADLEYLTGLKRRVLTFGNVEYAHSWVTGAFLAPGREPVFVLPRMVKEFDLPEGITGEV